MIYRGPGFLAVVLYDLAPPPPPPTPLPSVSSTGDSQEDDWMGKRVGEAKSYDQRKLNSNWKVRAETGLKLKGKSANWTQTESRQGKMDSNWKLTGQTESRGAALEERPENLLSSPGAEKKATGETVKRYFHSYKIGWLTIFSWQWRHF